MASNDFIVGMRQHIKDEDAAGNLTEYKILEAREGVAIAKSIGPVDEADYINGIQVGRRGASGVGVEFTDWKSHIIEFGSVDTPEFAVIARTAERMRNG